MKNKAQSSVYASILNGTSDVAYPLGLKGTVVGEGDTYDEALADGESAVRFHVETFGPEVLDAESYNRA